MICVSDIRSTVARKSPSHLPERKNLRALVLWFTIKKSNECGPGVDVRRVPQLASIPKQKRKAARQPTDNGTDENSDERKPRQRPASRCWDSADVRVHRVNKLTLRAEFKRLIPYFKQAVKAFGVKPEGIALCLKEI